MDSSQHKTILGIDPGTRCGFALRHRDGSIVSGTWNLSPRRHESGGMRYLLLEARLADLPRPDVVAYEEVRRHLGVDAAHIYGGIVATIQRWCTLNQVEYVGVPVGSVKKTATGKGNASKEAMIAAAQRRWPEWSGDDNEADARWIAEAAVALLGGKERQ